MFGEFSGKRGGICQQADRLDPEDLELGAEGPLSFALGLDPSSATCPLWDVGPAASPLCASSVRWE